MAYYISRHVPHTQVEIEAVSRQIEAIKLNQGRFGAIWSTRGRAAKIYLELTQFEVCEAILLRLTSIWCNSKHVGPSW